MSDLDFFVPVIFFLGKYLTTNRYGVYIQNMNAINKQLLLNKVKRKYTKIIRRDDFTPRYYTVQVCVDVQSFVLEYRAKTRSDAIWMQNQLSIALARLINSER